MEFYFTETLKILVEIFETRKFCFFEREGGYDFIVTFVYKNFKKFRNFQGHKTTEFLLFSM